MALLLAVSPAASEVRFNRDIRPIMADTCFRCHGPDKNTRMTGLRLDIREQALHKTPTGAIPIVPGDPEKSAIVERIFSSSPVRIMPPKYAHKELTQAQKETIRRWVQQGAPYEGHWAYQTVKRPPAPQVAAGKFPIRNAIDAFIQERLRRRRPLRPSREADRRTLLRRVALDLTGLPPTPAEDRRLSEPTRAPGAYEKAWSTA
jgi:hypothetical protein